MFVPLMPKGVEQVASVPVIAEDVPVFVPLMPKGVEQTIAPLEITGAIAPSSL